MAKRTYFAILLSVVFLLSLLSPQIYMTQASTQLIRNYSFSSTSYWTTEVLTWGEPKDPAEKSIIQNGYWFGQTVDSENWDYSDSLAGQGLKPQGGGVYWGGTSLISEPVLSQYVPDNTLVLKIRFKVPYTPIWMCFYNPLRGYSNSFSVVAVVFFEVKVRDNWGNEYWTTYVASDDGSTTTPPEFVACEKFNRWFYNYGTGSWYQADENHGAANYYTLYTTHDTCPHSIMAGWIVDNLGTYQTFTWDVSRDFRGLCTYLRHLHANRYISFHVVEGRVKAVMVSVEGYCAKGAAYIDYVTLTYNG